MRKQRKELVKNKVFDFLNKLNTDGEFALSYLNESSLLAKEIAYEMDARGIKVVGVYGTSDIHGFINTNNYEHGKGVFEAVQEVIRHKEELFQKVENEDDHALVECLPDIDLVIVVDDDLKNDYRWEGLLKRSWLDGKYYSIHLADKFVVNNFPKCIVLDIAIVQLAELKKSIDKVSTLDISNNFQTLTPCLMLRPRPLSECKWKKVFLNEHLVNKALPLWWNIEYKGIYEEYLYVRRIFLKKIPFWDYLKKVLFQTAYKPHYRNLYSDYAVQRAVASKWFYSANQHKLMSFVHFDDNQLETQKSLDDIVKKLNVKSYAHLGSHIRNDFYYYSLILSDDTTVFVKFCTKPDKQKELLHEKSILDFLQTNSFCSPKCLNYIAEENYHALVMSYTDLAIDGPHSQGSTAFNFYSRMEKYSLLNNILSKLSIINNFTPNFIDKPSQITVYQKSFEDISEGNYVGLISDKLLRYIEDFVKAEDIIVSFCHRDFEGRNLILSNNHICSDIQVIDWQGARYVGLGEEFIRLFQRLSLQLGVTFDEIITIYSQISGIERSILLKNIVLSGLARVVRTWKKGIEESNFEQIAFCEKFIQYVEDQFED